MWKLCSSFSYIGKENVNRAETAKKRQGAERMPGKLINTLKYGSSRTKRKIYLMFGILAVGVVLMVAAVMLESEKLGLVAFLMIFIDGMILFNTSFEQKTVSVIQRLD